MFRRLLAPLLSVALLHAAAPDPSALKFTEFAREPMVRNVVAVTVDEQGRVYATSVVRRQAADLDIRRFPEWIESDLSLTSVAAKQDFLRQQLTPAHSATFAGRFEDTNGDGSFDFNDLNLLADQITRLEDIDGDGVADRFAKFNATENTPVTGIAAGLAAWDGSLFAAVEPDLLRLDDTDGDGLPDQRVVLAHGFSHHIGYGGHNFSGTTIGPDGRIYAAVADRGMNVAAFDGSRHSNPHSGAVVRAELDGTGFEIFATGLRNLQEFAFDNWGNLLGVDNDGDMPGERERFVYVPEGSDTGWRTYWQYRENNYNPWQAEGLDVPPHAGQPAYLFPALSLYMDGPAGFVFNPGTALAPAYRDYFFLSTFPSRQLFAFQAEPQGAAFRMVNEHLAASGVLMVGLAFGADGKLYLADWSSDGYAMNEKGAVWTLDDPAFADSPARTETARLLALNWPAQDATFLRQHLAHADQRVRLKAQFELVRRDASQTLLAVARDPEADRFARGHAIWGLGQLLRRGQPLPTEALLALLADPDAELRTQTARIIGEARPAVPASAAALIPLLADPADRPRFFAAIALGRLRHREAVPTLLDYLKTDGADPYHRHAAVMGLAGSASAEQLAALTEAPAPHERLGAIVALRRQRSPLVARFLHDADPLVVAEAALAIYDDESIPDALPALAALLPETGQAHERTIRRALGAALRLRDAEQAAAVAAFAADANHDAGLRLHALALLQAWPVPPKLGPVQGAFRDLPPVEAAAIAPHVARALRDLAKDADPALARAAWQAAATFAIEPDTADLIAIVQQDTPLAADALRNLHPSDPSRLARLASTALSSQHAEVRAAALRALHRADADAALTVARDLALGSDIPVARAAIELLAAIDSPVLARALDALRAGTLPPELALDVVEAAARSPNAQTAAALSAYQESKDAGDPLAPYSETLHGGDPAAGRAIFQTSVVAQCTLCHRVDGPGSNVGPALNRIGRKAPEYLLRALVLPGADVAMGFGFTTLTLADGETVSGTLAAEDADTVTMKLADGSERPVAKSAITDRAPILSSMPPMGQIISRRELRDVLAYLQTLK